MSILSNIQDKVKSGMIKAYQDSLSFCDDPSRKFDAEYLFTVNVAKEIVSLNSYYGDPYQVFLEKNTESLKMDCIPLVKFGNPMKKGSSIFREKKIPGNIRKGRIDIAVYSDGTWGKQPLCAIELKGFNPQRKLVVDDLKRNAAWLALSGNTGHTVVSFSIFGAIHSFPKTKIKSDSQSQNNINSVDENYHNWMSQVGKMDGINAIIDTFTLSEELVGRVVDDVNEQVLDTSACHHFVGVIVTFEAKRI